MRTAYSIAALLSLFAAAVRTWDGETEILRVARETITDHQLLGFVHLTWYLVTVVFVVAGGALAYLAVTRRAGSRGAGLFIGILFLGWAVAIVVVSSAFVWHPGTVVPAVVTFLIGALATAGSIRQTTS